MDKLDKTAQKAVKTIYTQFNSVEEITVSSPEFKKTVIDFLVSQGLLEKTDASTLSGWAYLIRPTYYGESAFAEILSLPSSKVDAFIEQGEIIMKEEYHHVTEPGLVMPDYIDGPKSDQWFSEINIFNSRFLKAHPLHDQIAEVCQKHKRLFSPHENMMGYLKALASDDDFWRAIESNPQQEEKKVSNKVFIVHGHDDGAKQEMARALEKGGFDPIILHEQPDSGRTIIEKIERYSDVCYAVVLYTECDKGRDKNTPAEQEQYRARQNVVFEHGYLIGKLGRDHVTALVKGNVETPGDISGVVYTPMDAGGAWKIQLAKNMQDIGLSVDMNTFCR